jgi:hypothetical protein
MEHPPAACGYRQRRSGRFEIAHRAGAIGELDALRELLECEPPRHEVLAELQCRPLALVVRGTGRVVVHD